MKYHYLYYWTRLKDSIKYFFFPRQRWLWKKLKGSWKDFDSILEITVLEGLKFYVEQDLTLKNLNCKEPQDFPARQKKFNKELKYVYKLVTVNLVNLEKQLEEKWENLPKFSIEELDNARPPGYFERLREINDLEKKIYNLKSKVMVWAALNRNSLWT